MKLFISSCLMGENVRYDGTHNKIESELFDSILERYEIFTLCPEVEGGLNTPRIPAEIVQEKVITKEGEDVSRAFQVGALKTLELCLDEEISVALLKAKSPSCGNEKIYDGTFNGRLIEGNGKTAQLLIEHGITVFNETQILELVEFLNKRVD